MSIHNIAPLTTFPMQVARGQIAGYTHVHKFGSMPLATTDTVEDVWDGAGTYTFPASTADMTHVSQTTDQAAARGSIWTVEGLTTGYVEVTQNVTLDASLTTTAVELSTPLFRVNRMYMISPDITLTSTVRLHNTAENVDYAIILVDHNQTLMAIYTIPAGKTGYMITLSADYIPDATRNPNNVHYHLQVRRNATSQPWRAADSFGVTPGQSSYIEKFEVPVPYPEKSDIRITCRPEAKDAHVHASFELILIDD